MKKMSKSDMEAILLAAKIIDNIGRKYNVTGNLAQVYMEASRQLAKKHKA